ncbi:hypothetical protein BGX38DRAFT_1273040 [Terfezia claveryi]|nr:hypothetical protein BGX38DRAFT_1273040 [Terfezia claveryi]
MPGKGNRKDNPGKVDERNSPRKTRPVTGHLQPPSLDGNDTDASATTAKERARKIDDEDPVTPPTTTAASGGDTTTGPEGVKQLFPQTPTLPLQHAEAATETTQEELQTHKSKGKGKASVAAQSRPRNHPPDRPSPGPGKGKGKGPAKATSPSNLPQKNPTPSIRARAVVIHAAPTKYKLGLMRRWIEDDNEGIRILDIRWLLPEDRRVAKLASSLVIYMAKEADPTRGLRIGKRLFRTTAYDLKR